MIIVCKILWCVWAVLQVVAAIAVLSGRDTAASLTERQRRPIAGAFALAAVVAVVAAVVSGRSLGLTVVAAVAAAVIGLIGPLLIGFFGDGFQPRHHVVRLAALGGLTVLTLVAA